MIYIEKNAVTDQEYLTQRISEYDTAALFTKERKAEMRKMKNIALRQWGNLKSMWPRFTEASLIQQMQSILKTLRDANVNPPKDLLIVLAAYLSGRIEVRPK